jgi:predicted phosphate transport protein (TIGR00153 family)
MLPSRSDKVIEKQIDEFLDAVQEAVMTYQEAIRSYLAGRTREFTVRLQALDALENKGDRLSKEIEAHLYSHSLIPEHRGDVMDLLEHTDDIIDTFKVSLHQFDVEHPEIPERYNEGYDRLAETCCHAVESAVVAMRAFFRDFRQVNDHLVKVHHYEHEADLLSDSLKRQVFSDPELDLAHRTHLRYFALNVEKVSDCAQNVADRLAIYAIKRSI